MARSTLPVAAPLPLRQEWWQRLFGRRGAYSGSLNRSTVWFRVLAAVGALVAITLVLTVAGLHPIQRLTDKIGHIRGSGRIAGVVAVADPPGQTPTDPATDPAGTAAVSSPDPGRTAPWAVDGVRDRGWSVPWTATDEGNANATCPDPQAARVAPTAGSTAAALVLTLPVPADVREIGFEAGLSKPAERDDRWQPKTLELRWAGGECQIVSLANKPGLQRFGVGHHTVTGVRITVRSGYRPVDPGPARLDLGEVTLWQR